MLRLVSSPSRTTPTHVIRLHGFARGLASSSSARFQSTRDLGSQDKWHQDGSLPLIIGGREVITQSSFPVISPLTGKEIWSSSSASRQDAIDAANAAEAAFPAWSRTKPSERRDIFLKAADIIEKRREELKYYIHHEIGADEGYQNFMLALSTEGLKDTAGKIADAVRGQVPVSNHDGMKAIIHRRPYGVVLGIAPW